MQYRRLGKWGVKVSSISLGSWLTYGATVDRETATACIHKALDLGVNFFDTANVYARGAAEEVVGQALAGIRRDSYVLATKVFWPMGDGPNDRGLSRKHIVEQCNQSLRRLRTDYVDLYQCHRYDPEVPLEETVRAMEDLVSQGKVLYWGVSEWSAVQIDDAIHMTRAHGWHEPVSDQPVYNMFNRYIEDQVMPLARREGMGLIVFSPLAQGLLTGKYKAGEPAPAGSRGANPETSRMIANLATPERLQKVEALRQVAGRLGISLAQLALAWVLHHPEISSAITGATKPEQVEENVRAADITLSDEVMAEIAAILG